MSKNYLASHQVEPGDKLDYGVKGMRWGVRRDLKKLGSAGERKVFLQKREESWLAKAKDPVRAEKASRLAAKNVSKMAKGVRKNLKEQGINPKSPIGKQIYQENVRKLMKVAADEAAYKVYGRSNTGVYKVTLIQREDGTLRAIAHVDTDNPKLMKQMSKFKDVQHDGFEAEPEDLHFILIEDDEGFVVDVLPEGLLEHDAFDVVDYMAHYGIKGMKWGIRRTRAQLRANKAKSSESEKKIEEQKPSASTSKPSGSEGSADRYRRLQSEAKSGKQSDWDDEDLRFFNARTEAIRKVNQMYAKEPNWVKKAIGNTVRNTVQQQMQSVANQVATHYINEQLAKKGIKPVKDKKK